MFNFWGNDKPREQSMKLLDETGRYVITFNEKPKESNIISRGPWHSDNLYFQWPWSANGKGQPIQCTINYLSDNISKEFIEGLNNATSTDR